MKLARGFDNGLRRRDDIVHEYWRSVAEAFRAWQGYSDITVPKSLFAQHLVGRANVFSNSRNQLLALDVGSDQEWPLAEFACFLVPRDDGLCPGAAR
ncbi:hypothetical protein D9M70_558330 [compost metagenome]